MLAVTPALLGLLLVQAEPMPSQNLRDRPPSIIAPSIPQLSRDEERALDELIDRFMKADIGTLTGTDALQAVRDFKGLGMEAVPALIRGLNRAADINHTCPALQLTLKLKSLLSQSNDPELLEFARENIGAGVSDRSRHRGALQQLRTEVMLRKNAVVRLNPQQPPRLTTTPPANQPQELGTREPRSLSTPELIRLLRTENNEAVQRILRELETRKGTEILSALAGQVNASTSDIRQLSRELLLRHIGRMDAREVLLVLEHPDAEARRTAVEVLLDRHPRALPQLIDRIADKDEMIRQKIRQALVREARNVDFGPETGADLEEAHKARDRWRTWWDLNRR